MPVLAENKDAKRRFDIVEKLEAGIVLAGHEVKAAKTGNANLRGSYITLTGGEAYLVNAHIGRYKPAGPLLAYNPARPRKLLLTKHELKFLLGKANEKGLTVVPLSVYSKRGILKVSIAVARGKRTHDKRAAIQDREVARKLRRAVKEQYRIR